MRVILFLLFLYLVIRIVRMLLVQKKTGRATFNRTYTFHGQNPFGHVRRPGGNVKKKRNFDNLEDADFEEIDDKES